MRKLYIAVAAILIMLMALAGCQRVAPAPRPSLVLATTTSTYDSGLLQYLLPRFESAYGIEVYVISVGSGAAIELGKRGDCDIILVHSREMEDAFVSGGFGTARYDVMYNDYVYVGPKQMSRQPDADDLAAALKAIETYMEESGHVFLSRGDNSGTHNMERSLWPKAGIADFSEQKWYLSIGKGMGDTLVAANEMQAFTLSDRGTYLAMQKNLANSQIIFAGDKALLNPYGIIPVNPAKHSHVNYQGAMRLVEFLVSDDIQTALLQFGVTEYGQPLFFPNAAK